MGVSWSCWSTILSEKMAGRVMSARSAVASSRKGKNLYAIYLVEEVIDEGSLPRRCLRKPSRRDILATAGSKHRRGESSGVIKAEAGGRAAWRRRVQKLVSVNRDRRVGSGGDDTEVVVHRRTRHTVDVDESRSEWVSVKVAPCSRRARKC